MIQTLIGKKVDQMQTFLTNGQRIPVTEILLSENVVLQVKTVEKDSYAAVQLGAGIKKKPIRALLGHAKKAGRESASAKVKEVRVGDTSELPAIGEVVAIEAVFQPGDIVQVTGTSKGKGFAGGVKRHGFKGGPKTHGQSDRHRAPGSIGQGTTPGRVYKGKRMAGRMGTDTVTVKNLTVVDVDAAAGKILISGLVPGYKNSWVSITKTGEDKKFVPLLEAEERRKAAEEAQAEIEVTKEEALPKEEVAEEATTSAEEANVTEETKEPEATKVSDEPDEQKEVSTESNAPKDVKPEATEGEKKEEDVSEEQAEENK
jgi:large subunit ribosomal protein L3